MRILVCGSCGWDDVQLIFKRLDGIHNSGPGVISSIVQGCAAGADIISWVWAGYRGVPTEDFPPDWRTHGKKAGFMRNQAMVDTRPDHVLAFHLDNTPGTAHTIRRAIRAGLTVEVYERDSSTGRTTHWQWDTGDGRQEL